MTKKELKERVKALEKELAILELEFEKQIRGLKEKHLLTNDRIDEAFFIIKEIDKKLIKDAKDFPQKKLVKGKKQRRINIDKHQKTLNKMSYKL